MSLYPPGMSLKALLECPELVNPPSQNKVSNLKTGKLQDAVQTLPGQSAFLGPTSSIWGDKTLPFDEDLKLEFMDLDEFLNENECLPELEGGKSSISGSSPMALLKVFEDGIDPQTPAPLAMASPVSVMSSPGSLTEQLSPGQRTIPYADCHSPSSQPSAASSPKQFASKPASPVPEVQVDFSQDDIALATVPGQDFDPRQRQFSEEELRPQPVIKKSRKVFVPDDCKDDKYWSRRRKNNVAAKRSRDARRIKENQIALRAAFLEKENNLLKAEMTRVKTENKLLKVRLSKYEDPV